MTKNQECKVIPKSMFSDNIADIVDFKAESKLVKTSSLLSTTEMSHMQKTYAFVGVQVDGKVGLAQLNQLVPARTQIVRDTESQRAVGIPAVSGGSI